MPNPYRALLARPAGLRFSAAAFVARFPMSMEGIGIVLLVSRSRGSYALAGALSAGFAVSSALGTPLTSRAVDRLGQLRVGRVLTVAACAGMVLFVALASGDAPAYWLFPPVLLAGASTPAVGSYVRARWAHLLDGGTELRTAFSLESVVDELIFILGPPLVTVLAATVGPAEALLSTLVFLVVGMALFLVQRGSEPPASGSARHEGTAVLSVPGLRVLVVVMVALGGVFGSVEVVTVAYAGERGRPLVAGLVLATYAAGSLVAGIVYGAAHLRTPLARQLVVLCCLVPVSVVALPFVGDHVGLLTALVLVAGFVVSPSLIATFALAEELSPEGKLNEALTWATTGIALGVAAGAAVAGAVVDRVGAPQAYVVSLASGVLTAVVVLLGAAWLRRVPATR